MIYRQSHDYYPRVFKRPRVVWNTITRRFIHTIFFWILKSNRLRNRGRSAISSLIKQPKSVKNVFSWVIHGSNLASQDGRFSIIEPRSSRHNHTMITTTNDHDTLRSLTSSPSKRRNGRVIWQVRASEHEKLGEG